MIVSDKSLQRLIRRPTIGLIRERYLNEFITTLTGMDSQKDSSVFSNLEEIQFISNEEPYIPIQLFSELRKLSIEMKTIQLPASFEWPSLVDLHLRGTIDMDKLEPFLRQHALIRKLHIGAVSTLRPIGPSPSLLLEPLRYILSSRLDAALVESILGHAEINANGHERSLLREIHAQLDKETDEKTVREIRQAIVIFFERLLQLELDRYSLDIGKTLPLKNLHPFKLGYSIDYFWEDELAIKGKLLPLLDETSRSGLWTNTEAMESPEKLYVYQQIVFNLRETA